MPVCTLLGFCVVQNFHCQFRFWDACFSAKVVVQKYFQYIECYRVGIKARSVIFCYEIERRREELGNVGWLSLRYWIDGFVKKVSTALQRESCVENQLMFEYVLVCVTL